MAVSLGSSSFDYSEVPSAEEFNKDIEIPLQRLSVSSESSHSEASDHLPLVENAHPYPPWQTSEKLPPIDSGGPAWRFLGGIWLIEAMFWGFPLTFGLFQSHYSSHPLFSSSESRDLIPTIGALATGLSYLLCPVTSAIALRFPHHQRHMLGIGYGLCALSLVLASFATKIWHLLLTQGVLYGVGWVSCYTPFLIMLNGWFDKRRGLAYGILFGASGVSGLMLPFILEGLLSRYGFRTTLRIYVAAALIISGPPLLFVKHRIPPRADHSTNQSLSAGLTEKSKRPSNVYIRNPLFHIFAIAILLQGLSFFIPNIFLPTYADLLSLPPSAGDTLLAVTALAQVTGQILLGHFSDRVTIHLPSHTSAFTSALAVLFLWGSTTGTAGEHSLLKLGAFSAVWGGFAGSYSVLWTRVAAELAKGYESETIRIYSWFSAERGIANVLAGPIAGVLIRGDVQKGTWGLGKYKILIGFTAACLLMSTIVGAAGWFWDTLRGNEKRRENRH